LKKCALCDLNLTTAAKKSIDCYKFLNPGEFLLMVLFHRFTRPYFTYIS